MRASSDSVTSYDRRNVQHWSFYSRVRGGVGPSIGVVVKSRGIVGRNIIVDLTIPPPSPQLRTSPRFGWVGPGRLNTKTAHICIYVLLFGFVASWLDGNKRDEPMFVSILALVHSSLQPLHKNFPARPHLGRGTPKSPQRNSSARSDRTASSAPRL